MVTTARGRYFGSDIKCFGVLHQPERSKNIAVLIINEFGYRGLWVHWSLRHLANVLADLGATVLRFDLPGTYDSPTLTGNRVEFWERGVDQAIDQLCACAGTEAVTLVGFGLGAMLAFNAAQRTPRVIGLELIQPFSSGMTYVEFVNNKDAIHASDEEGRLIAAQYLARAEEESLLALRTTFGPRKHCASVNVIGFEGDLSSIFCNDLDRAGYAYNRHEFQDGSQWLLDPLFSKIPAFFEGISQRLLPLAGAESTVTNSSPISRVVDADSDYTEEVLSFADKDGSLQHGILAIPAKPLNPRALILFFGTSANRRTGIHNNNTSWARSLAGVGFATLRFDATGIGDSEPRSGHPNNEVMVARNYGDALVLLDELRSRGYQTFGAIGVSLGGYNALKFAQIEASCRGVLGINVPRYVVQESFDDAIRANIKTSRAYWEALRDPVIWRRLVCGDVNVRGIGTVLVNRIWKKGSSALKLKLGTLVKSKQVYLGQAHRDMADLLARGDTLVHLLYGENDRYIENFEHEFGKGGAVLVNSPNFRLTILPGVDHSISTRDSVTRTFEVIRQFFATALA